MSKIICIHYENKTKRPVRSKTVPHHHHTSTTPVPNQYELSITPVPNHYSLRGSNQETSKIESHSNLVPPINSLVLIIIQLDTIHL